MSLFGLEKSDELAKIEKMYSERNPEKTKEAKLLLEKYLEEDKITNHDANTFLSIAFKFFRNLERLRNDYFDYNYITGKKIQSDTEIKNFSLEVKNLQKEHDRIVRIFSTIKGDLKKID